MLASKKFQEDDDEDVTRLRVEILMRIAGRRLRRRRRRRRGRRRRRWRRGVTRRRREGGQEGAVCSGRVLRILQKKNVFFFLGNAKEKVFLGPLCKRKCFIWDSIFVLCYLMT